MTGESVPPMGGQIRGHPPRRFGHPTYFPSIGGLPGPAAHPAELGAHAGLTYSLPHLAGSVKGYETQRALRLMGGTQVTGKPDRLLAGQPDQVCRFDTRGPEAASRDAGWKASRGRFLYSHQRLLSESAPPWHPHGLGAQPVASQGVAPGRLVAAHQASVAYLGRVLYL